MQSNILKPLTLQLLTLTLLHPSSLNSYTFNSELARWAPLGELFSVNCTLFVVCLMSRPEKELRKIKKADGWMSAFLQKSHRQDLNLRPTDYESVALPAELRWLIFQVCKFKTKLLNLQPLCGSHLI